MDEIILRYVNLPLTIKGKVMYGEDCYNIYLNCNLTRENNRKTLLHEIKHIKKNHLFSENSVVLLEREIK